MIDFMSKMYSMLDDICNIYHLLYSSKCKHTEVCARCSATGHKDDTCTVAFKCVNCGENHASYNKKFSFYRREYDIQSIRVSNNVLFLKLAKFINKLMDRG